MNQKHYIGKRVTSMELYDDIGPVTGVALIVDDENEVFAGNESGYVLEMECPYATQAMANSILAKAKGQIYKGYSAENAPLSIEAELGDGVTVGGIYSMLAHRKLSFGAGHLSDIAAPGSNEVDHEYPYISPLERQVRRNKAETYSLISKTAEEIRMEVFGEDGYTGASIAVQLDNIRQEVTGKINGDDARALIDLSIGEISLEASSAAGTSVFILKSGETILDTQVLKLTVDAAYITGSLTIGQLPDDLATKGEIPTTTSQLENNSGYMNAQGVTTVIGGIVTTDYVNALGITAKSVSASNVTAGTLNASFLTLDGLLHVTKTDISGSASGYIGASTTKGAIVVAAANQNVGCVVNNTAAKLTYFEDKMIWVHSGGCYSSETIQIYSDKSLKNSVSYDLSKEETLFAKLRPCSFAYNSDKDSKMHWGFVAQDFIESVVEVGLDTNALAVLGQYEGKYSIGYGEITALNTHMIQKLMQRVDALEKA